MVDLVVKNGQVVTPWGTSAAAVAVREGKIVALGAEQYLPPAARIIDAKGLHILPGLVDPHYHPSFLFPFNKTTQVETKAAAAGGVTTLGLYLPFRKEGLVKSIEELRKLYEENALIDSFFHAMIRDEGGLKEISDCPAQGITSFKFSLGYKGPQAEKLGVPPFDDGMLFEGLTRVSQLGPGVWAAIHAENIDIALRLRERLIEEGRRDMAAWNDSRPSLCEVECTARCIYLAKVTGCPYYIVHMTIGEGVEMVARAKAQGIRLVAETCPQYLTHNSEKPVPLLIENPALANVNPPLRDKESNRRLWQGIKNGVIECIGSDHSAYTLEQKGRDIWDAPMGLGNLAEFILPVMLSEGVNKGRISLPKVVEVCCYNPARIFGIYPQKGGLEVGSDADMVIVDLKKKVKVTPEKLHSLCDWTIYDGWEFTGWPVLTLRRGEVIVEEGQVLGSPGTGRYIWRRA